MNAAVRGALALLLAVSGCDDEDEPDRETDTYGEGSSDDIAADSGGVEPDSECYERVLCYQFDCDEYLDIVDGCTTLNDACAKAQEDLDACYVACGWSGSEDEETHQDAMVVVDVCRDFGVNSDQCHAASTTCMDA